MNAQSLLIVESPSKAKTISKYLDGEYEVLACVGHVKDLPKKALNIDIENDESYIIAQKLMQCPLKLMQQIFNESTK